MNSDSNQRTRKSSVWLAVVFAALIAVGLVGWGMWSVEHVATGSSRREFTLNVDFDKFRQIMVRKNATEAIVAHSGMKLLAEKVGDVSIDVPRQNRPILNAILGKANADLVATKQITVSIEDPNVGVSELTLNQHVDVQPDAIDVRSEATGPAGNLKAYSTRLHASKFEDTTKVELSIDQTVRVKVPKFFIASADQRVQRAADDSTEEQERALRDFIAKFENDAIVLPELR